MQRHVLLTRSCRYALPVICRSSSSSCWTETATKDRFIEEEKAWDAKVQWDSLSPEEAEIVRAHKRAILNELTTYDDDKGRKVKTRLDHFLRGSCCGNGCRHCIYGHINVPEDRKGAKIFNSAFWVDIQRPRKRS